MELNDNIENSPIDKKRIPLNKFKILFLISIVVIGMLTVNTLLQVSTINKYEQQRNDLLNQFDDSTDLELEFMQNINFAVNYGTIPYLYWVKIPFETYFNFRIYKSHDLDRTSYYSLVNSLEEFCDSSSIVSIAQSIRDLCIDPLDNEEVANAILNFVQDKGEFEASLHYISEEDDIPKYPIETIVEGGGDCEDLSILFVSLLESIGFDTILIVIPGHCYAGVYLSPVPTHGDGWSFTFNEKPYYTCETTAEGWEVGDLPVSSQGESAYIEEVIC